MFFWTLMAGPSYLMVIAMVLRLGFMVTQYVGMLQYQKVLKQTCFVGCASKITWKTRKNAMFGHLLQALATIY